MTPAERLKQIEEDERIICAWLGEDRYHQKPNDALARLVALAKKGAACE